MSPIAGYRGESPSLFRRSGGGGAHGDGASVAPVLASRGHVGHSAPSFCAAWKGTHVCRKRRQARQPHPQGIGVWRHRRCRRAPARAPRPRAPRRRALAGDQRLRPAGPGVPADAVLRRDPAGLRVPGGRRGAARRPVGPRAAGGAHVRAVLRQHGDRGHPRAGHDEPAEPGRPHGPGHVRATGAGIQHAGWPARCNPGEQPGHHAVDGRRHVHAEEPVRRVRRQPAQHAGRGVAVDRVRDLRRRRGPRPARSPPQEDSRTGSKRSAT